MAQSPCWQYCCLLNVWASNRHRAQCSRHHVLWRGDVCFAGDTINSSSTAAEQLMRCDEHCYQVIKDKWRLTQKHGLDSAASPPGAQQPKTDGEHNGPVTAALFNTSIILDQTVSWGGLPGPQGLMDSHLYTILYSSGSLTLCATSHVGE